MSVGLGQDGCNIYNILNPRRVSLFYSHKEKGISGLHYIQHTESQKSFFILFT